jgi:chromosomal replication initiation ATPase DnaA
MLADLYLCGIGDAGANTSRKRRVREAYHPRMDSLDTQIRVQKIEAIQCVVAKIFGLSVEELKQKAKGRVAIVPRQIAMYLVKHETDASLPEIGKHFGRMHHTTVMHAIAKVHHQRGTDVATDEIIIKLIKALRRD